MSDPLKTPLARLSYPNLFEARGFDGGEKKFSCTLIFDEEAQKTPEFKALKAAAKQAAIDEWGADKIPANLRTPFRDGAEKDGEGYGPGKIFISVSTKQRPGIVSTMRDPETKKRMPIEDESEIYAGCYVLASIRPFAYEVKGNKGISFGLNNLMKVKDGEMLGNRTRAEDDFDSANSYENEAGVDSTTDDDDIF